ncbi:unnamed protein product [Gadus morhua 'NCC']
MAPQPQLHIHSLTPPGPALRSGAGGAPRAAATAQIDTTLEVGSRVSVREACGLAGDASFRYKRFSSSEERECSPRVQTPQHTASCPVLYPIT